MTKTLRIFIGTALLSLLSVFQTAHSQSSSLRIVVPYAPGGSPDQLARIIGEKLQKTGKYGVVVDNRPGAGGTLAANAVRNSVADGTTLLLTDSSTYSIAPSLKKDLGASATKDFKPVGLAATSPLYLVALPRNGTTVAGFRENLKAKPGQAIASSGAGSAHHFLIEMMKFSTGLDILHIPYRGSSQTVPAVLAGDVAATFSGLANAQSMAQAGKLTILAIAEPQRSSLTPDIPTLVESGMKDVQLTITLGLLAPPGTPDGVVTTLNEDISAVLRMPDTTSRLNTLGLVVATSDPRAFSQIIAAELIQYSAIVKRANLSVD